MLKLFVTTICTKTHWKTVSSTHKHWNLEPFSLNCLPVDTAICIVHSTVKLNKNYTWIFEAQKLHRYIARTQNQWDKIRDCHQTSCQLKIQETWLENWLLWRWSKHLFQRNPARKLLHKSHDYLMSLTWQEKSANLINSKSFRFRTRLGQIHFVRIAKWWQENGCF